jgi:hypothetical protein
MITTIIQIIRIAPMLTLFTYSSFSYYIVFINLLINYQKMQGKSVIALYSTGLVSKKKVHLFYDQKSNSVAYSNVKVIEFGEKTLKQPMKQYSIDKVLEIGVASYS